MDRVLEDAIKDGNDHPALELLGMWKNNYQNEDAKGNDNINGPIFVVDNSKRAAPVPREVRPAGDANFRKALAWLRSSELM